GSTAVAGVARAAMKTARPKIDRRLMVSSPSCSAPGPLTRPRLPPAVRFRGRLCVRAFFARRQAPRRLDGEGADFGNVDRELELAAGMWLEMELSERVRDRAVQGLAAAHGQHRDVAHRSRRVEVVQDLPDDRHLLLAGSRRHLELDRVAPGLVE